MARVKRGVVAHKRRKNVLKDAKGFRWGRKSKFRLAKEALQHAWAYSFRDRKTKKRNFRRLWQLQINAATRPQGITYSRFIDQLKKKEIAVDRKILANLAQNRPEIFKEIVEDVKVESNK